MLIESNAFETAWVNNSNNASTGICSAMAMKTRPNWAVVEYERVRLMSTWARATSDPPMALMLPITSITPMAMGESCKIGITLRSTIAPQVTTTELRRIEAGFGPSIASSSQRCIGN